MLGRLKIVSVVSALLIAGVSLAQTPAGAPAGSTGLCRDGSYWTGPTKKGACHGHKGVQDWYATGAPAAAGAAAVAAAAPAASTPAVASRAPAAPAVAAAPSAPAMPASKSAPMPAAAAAPGGGADKVWVNSSSKVYHCPADRWYGKTKSGAYMSEADAIAQGNHADHGKACTK